MYIRITPATVDMPYADAKEQEVIRFTDEQLIPLLRQLPGFISYTGATDRATGRIVAITTWDNMEHAQGLRAALGGLVAQMEALGIHFEPPQVYEVIKQV
jgi:quinol monooxygenase YgiN